MNLQKLRVLEQWVHPNLQPDLTLLFDVPLDVARNRLNATRSLDKFEREEAEFFAATRAEYLRRAEEFSSRVRLIDGNRTIAEIQALLEKIIATV